LDYDFSIVQPQAIKEQSTGNNHNSLNWPSPGPLTLGELILNKEYEQIDRSSIKTDFSPPENKIQSTLIKLWEDSLKIKGIGIDDNFISLGGDSITALRLMPQIDQQIGLSISLHEIMEFSIRNIASRAKGSNLESTKSYNIQLKKRDELIPATFGQIRLWASDNVSSKNDNIIPIMYDIEGLLNINILEESFNLLLKKHVILRTNFIYSAGKLLQKVRDNKRMQIEVIEISKNNDNLVKQLSKLNNTKFNLDSDLLIRVVVFRYNINRFKLFFIIHHSVFDGWSINILEKDLSFFYKKLINKDKVHIKPEYSFYGYSESIQRYNNLEFLKPKEKKWIENWANKKTSRRLIWKSPNPETFMRLVEVPTTLSKKIEKVKNGLYITTSTFYLTALFMTLDEKLSKDGILTLFANRLKQEYFDAIGFFTNLILVENLENTSNIDEYLIAVNKLFSNSVNYGNIPFGYFHKRIDIPKVVLTIQIQYKKQLKLPNLQTDRVDPILWPCPFPLMIDVENNSKNFRLRFRFQQDSFNESEGNSFIKDYMSNLKGMLDSCAINLNEYDRE